MHTSINWINRKQKRTGWIFSLKDIDNNKKNYGLLFHLAFLQDCSRSTTYAIVSSYKQPVGCCHLKHYCIKGVFFLWLYSVFSVLSVTGLYWVGDGSIQLYHVQFRYCNFEYLPIPTSVRYLHCSSRVIVSQFMARCAKLRCTSELKCRNRWAIFWPISDRYWSYYQIKTCPTC